MEVVVPVSRSRFARVRAGLSCLELFQSMFAKIMFAVAVLCSSGTVPEPAEHGEVDHGAAMVFCNGIDRVVMDERNMALQLLALPSFQSVADWNWKRAL